MKSVKRAFKEWFLSEYDLWGRLIVREWKLFQPFLLKCVCIGAVMSAPYWWPELLIRIIGEQNALEWFAEASGIPESKNSFNHDLDAFNHSLVDPSSLRTPEPREMPLGLRDFMDTPPAERFQHLLIAGLAEATFKSEFAGTAKTKETVDQLRTHLKIHPPVVAGGTLPYGRLIGLNFNDRKNIVVVNMLRYDDDGNSQSERWFLLKHRYEDKFEIIVNLHFYDWVCLQYGDRMSDTLARQFAIETQGGLMMDQFIGQLEIIIQRWSANPIAAKTELTKLLDSIPFEEEKAQAAELAASALMDANLADASYELLKQIRPAYRTWNASRMLAMAEIDRGNTNEATAIMAPIKAMSPEGPFTIEIDYRIAIKSGDLSMATEKLVAACKLMPYAENLFDELLHLAPDEELETLVDCFTKRVRAGLSFQNDRHWRLVTQAASENPSWGDRFAALTRERETEFNDAMLLVEAHAEYGRGNVKSAVEKLNRIEELNVYLDNVLDLAKKDLRKFIPER